MNIWEKFKDNKRIERQSSNSKIKSALTGISGRTASILFDINQDSPLKVTVDQNANIKAIRLVSDLLGGFNLPFKPLLEDHGIIKNATENDGTISEGIVKIGAIIRTLMGHKAYIDVPVIVKNKSLLEPAVFFYDGAPYILCEPAIEQLICRGSLKREMQPKGLYSAVDIASISRMPISNSEHMYSPGARNPYNLRKWSDKEQRKRINIDEPVNFPELWEELPEHCLDPAERNRDKLLHYGTDVILKEDVEVRERGGGTLIIPNGEKGTIYRDEDGTGCMVCVCFPKLDIKATIPKRMLKHAATISQLTSEIKEMIDQGYSNVDIKDGIKRRFSESSPSQVEEALYGLSKSRN